MSRTSPPHTAPRAWGGERRGGPWCGHEPGDGADQKRGGEAAGPGFGGDDGGPAFGVGVEGCGGSAEGDADRAAKQSEEDGFGEELGTDVAFGSAQGATQSDLGAAFED